MDSLLVKDRWPKWPQWVQSGNEYLKDVIDSGRWTLRGKFTGKITYSEKVANEFMRYNGSKYVVLTTTGSVALKLALDALNIGNGDEVIVPNMTWIAPITAVLEVGAIPVFVDVEKGSTCIDAKRIEEKISNKTKAIIAVHLHRHVCDLDELIRIKEKYNLLLIEDCSQAHGACWNSKRVGNYGDVGVYSLNQEKVLTCGEGGIVVTNDEVTYDKLFRTKTDGARFNNNVDLLGMYQLEYGNESMGLNQSISEFQSAVLLSQLEGLEEQNKVREQNLKLLDELLRDVEGIQIPDYDKRCTSRTVYEYTFFLDPKYINIDDIEKIADDLSEEVGFSIHRTDSPVHINPMFCPEKCNRFNNYCETEEFKRFRNALFTNSMVVYDTILVFPHSILLADKHEIEYIARTIKEIIRRWIKSESASCR